MPAPSMKSFVKRDLPLEFKVMKSPRIKCIFYKEVLHKLYLNL